MFHCYMHNWSSHDSMCPKCSGGLGPIFKDAKRIHDLESALKSVQEELRFIKTNEHSSADSKQAAGIALARIKLALIKEK